MKTNSGAPTTGPARPTTISDIRDLALVDVWSASRPSAAGLLGVSRATAYALASSGELPVIRIGQKRLAVPVRRLLAMIDAEPEPVSD